MNTGQLIITCDKQLMDKQQIHAFLAQTYWARHIPLDILAKAIDNSLCVAALLPDSPGYKVVGFARMITDYATFAYLADVYVLPDFRGRGISRQLVAQLDTHEELQSLRRRMLVTRDAHGLYEKFGYQAAATPERIMEKLDAEVYQRMLLQSGSTS